MILIAENNVNLVEQLNPSIEMMKMKQVNLIVFFLLTFCNYGKAQQNFQKVYTFQDTFAIFNDVFVTDSCYYYTSTTGGGNRGFFNFGKIKLEGSEEVLLLDQDLTSHQRIMFSQADMDTNFRGNFVTNFVNSSINGTYPRVKEITRQGMIINDFSLIDFWVNDSLSFNTDPARIIINNADSSYFLAFQYYDHTTDDNNGYNGSAGVILIKLKFDGTVLWNKKFHFSPIGLYKPFWGLRNLIKLPNNEMLIVIQESMIYAPTDWNLNWTKTHFIKLDENGNQITQDIFQDGQHCPSDFAGTLLEDGGLLYSYFESILGGVPPNTDYFLTRPVIARFDNNYNLVWKKTLRDFYGTDYSLLIGNMIEVRIVQDSLFVGAFNYIEEIEVNVAYKERLRLSQYNLNGVNKWNRDYIYYPTDDFNDPEYGIYDLELTPDGGYIMVGEVQILDSLFIGSPGQFGYILKTNCLGFLDNPISEFSYSNNSGSVEFTNQSVQAGKYMWIFGDGDTLETSEYIDSVTHVYSEFGTYSVKLIAYGCVGQNDTISKLIDVNVFSEGYVGDGTLVTIAPNPVFSGESISMYFGDLKDGNYKMEVCDVQGKLIYSELILADLTTYIFSLPVSAGTYFVRLMNNEKIVEVEKLIIQ